MKKFIFLYLAPPTTAEGFENPPFTWNDLEDWAALAGNALAEKGMLFAPSGKDIVDTGAVQGAPYQIYGYSVVQAENMDAAISLAKNHPMLLKERKGFYEIQIQEAFAGDIPDNILHPPIEEVAATTPTPEPSTPPPATATVPSQPPASVPAEAPRQDEPSTPQPNPAGELDISHDSDDDKPLGGQSGGQPPSGGPGNVVTPSPPPGG